jgi:endonuclease III
MAKTTGPAAKRGGKTPPAAPGAGGRNRRPERVAEILARLARAYPDAHLLLRFDNPFELLCATVLAARATDEKVNEVTPELFRRWPTPERLAAADFDAVAEVVHATGFFRQKTERLLAVARGLVESFGGRVPDEVAELTTLPGVGKKTAILVVNHAFGKPAGIAVDTHVLRVGRRLDWTAAKDPEKVEGELREVIPREHWIHLQDLLAFHGRAHCRAPRPRCAGCPVADLCYSPEKV